MSLLHDLMANAIDEGYLAAAKKRAAAASAPTSTPARSRRGAVALVVLVLAGAGALFAMSAVASHRGAAKARHDRADLVRQIDAHEADNDTMRHQLASLQAQVNTARDAALSASDEGSRLTGQLRTLELVTGADAVEGPGIEVMLDDAPGSAKAGSSGLIYDRDLQAVVNALFASGAEAIAVNGERLTTRTAIREAGDAILVDYRPISPPYRVDAIGPPGIEAAFRATQTAVLFENWHQVFGLGFAIADRARLTLPSAATPAVANAKPLESP